MFEMLQLAVVLTFVSDVSLASFTDTSDGLAIDPLRGAFFSGSRSSRRKAAL